MGDKVEDLSLPNAIVQRIIKEALPPGTIVAKDARLGISRATSLFILYIGQASSEIANTHKRKTVKESDVLEALKEADFDDLIPLLEKEMEIAKEKKSKKAQTKKTTSKSKPEPPTATVTPAEEEESNEMET